MENFSYKSKKNIISPLSIIFIFFFIITKINCSSLNSTEIEQYNKTITKYSQMATNYVVFSKKMEKITLNIFLRIRYKDLKRTFEELRTEIDNLKLKFDKNEKISENLIKANNLTDEFEIRYINSISAYKRFEETKKMLGGMLKTFIIVLSIIIFIVLTLIGIGSYYVIKYNNKRRYIKLQEEVSIRIGQTEDKEKNETENKNEFMAKSTQEDIPSTNDNDANKVKAVVESNNSPLSKEYLSKK